MVHRFISLTPTWYLIRYLFSNAHHLGSLPTQLRVVWSLLLKNGFGRPSSISYIVTYYFFTYNSCNVIVLVTHYLVAHLAAGESALGTSPNAALRTVRERLRSYSSHYPTGDPRPNLQWTNNLGSRFLTQPNHFFALCLWPWNLLYFLMTQRMRYPSMFRRNGYMADL